MKVVNDFTEYQLLDMAKGKKLEKWHDVILLRPDPQIIWEEHLSKENYSIDAIYDRSSSGGGSWNIKNKKLPAAWTISYQDLKFGLKLMGFKHTGLFPEQAYNWNLIREKIRQRIEREPSITDLRNILSGKTIKSFGDNIDCQDIIVPAVKQYLETTYMSILDKYKEQFSKCDKVILAGGGSRILAPYINNVFKKSNFYITAPEPEFSNVRGYRYIVMSKIKA